MSKYACSYGPLHPKLYCSEINITLASVSHSTLCRLSRMIDPLKKGPKPLGLTIPFSSITRLLPCHVQVALPRPLLDMKNKNGPECSMLFHFRFELNHDVCPYEKKKKREDRSPPAYPSSYFAAAFIAACVTLTTLAGARSNCATLTGWTGALACFAAIASRTIVATCSVV